MTAVSTAYVSAALAASAQYKIVTASEKGTYIVIGRDLATYIAAPVDIELESVAIGRFRGKYPSPAL